MTHVTSASTLPFGCRPPITVLAMEGALAGQLEQRGGPQWLARGILLAGHRGPVVEDEHQGTQSGAQEQARK